MDIGSVLSQRSYYGMNYKTNSNVLKTRGESEYDVGISDKEITFSDTITSNKVITNDKWEPEKMIEIINTMSGTERINASCSGNKPSFASKVYNQEEMEKNVEDLIKSNEYKRKTLRQCMLEMEPDALTATQSFWDDPNTHYTFEEFIKEMERRYGCVDE